MAKIYLIESSQDGTKAVKAYIAENRMALSEYRTARDAVRSGDVPSLIVLCLDKSLDDMRGDIAYLRDNPTFAMIPRILILPHHANISGGLLDVNEAFQLPVDKLKFLAAVNKFTERSPRRAFKILVTIRPEGTNVKYPGVSMNFSATGMVFECKNDFQVGQGINVSFVNPKNRNRLSLQADIVRRDATPKSDAILYGVRFTDLSQDSSKGLMEFIVGEAAPDKLQF